MRQAQRFYREEWAQMIVDFVNCPLTFHIKLRLSKIFKSLIKSLTHQFHITSD